MAKVQVYLPDALQKEVRSKLPKLNVSAVLQKALEERLAEQKRLAAMDKAIRSYEREFGKITDAQMDAALERMRRSARHPNAPRTRPKRRAA
jgi:Arc/MetJ-type ribon-helix-helix transcriptional regulator